MSSVSSFLLPAAEMSRISSSSGYMTCSLQPLVYRKLMNHCNMCLDEDSLDGGHVPECVELAARFFKEKIKKFEGNLC